jgi:outer membrane protein OmpA-like peptidoglycan-associated protein
MNFKNCILALVAFVFLQRSFAFAENETQWSAGAGIGPNFSQLDAVSDDLKSSVGGTLWLSKEWLASQHRLDISFDYFSFIGATDYHALSAAYGWTFKNEFEAKPFILLGGGLGRANNFPYSIEKNQNTLHLFARFGAEKVFKVSSLDVGFIFDAFFVKLDGNNASRAYLGLPMLTLQYNFDNTPSEPKSQSIAPQAIAPAPQKMTVVEIDSDHDGVMDSRDECPHTPANTKVNSIGCPINTEIKKNLRVEFKNDRSEILSKYYGQINEFAGYLKDRPDLKVTIEGHTDSVGSRKHNLKLSRARAEAIRNYLITKKHINKTRIKAVGYGPDRPEYKNSSDQNKQKNRRVIAVLN